MNNKYIGTAFEKRVCDIFKNRGYWVHFISPDARGAQPFDIIAVKDGKARAIECKTLSDNLRSFSIKRLEDNQVNAFDYWKSKGNGDPLIFIEHCGHVHVVSWTELKAYKKVDLESGDYVWM